MRESLHFPKRIRLRCGACAEAFWVGLRAIDGKTHLVCPSCGGKVEIYSSLPSELRRAVYRSAREKFEEALLAGSDLAEYL